jgi:sugar/nucleoside kinase (ribokinase family)
MQVYCFGHISTGKLIRIKNAFPCANGYGEIIDVTDNYCGEALATAVVLKRLGINVELEGNWLGDNESGKRTLEFIINEGIGSEGVIIKPGYIGVDEIVISDEKSRTVFGRYEDLLFTTQQWTEPDVEKVINSDVICCDPSFGESSEFVLQFAEKLNKKFVGIDSPYDSASTAYSDVLIISEDYLQQKYKEMSYFDLFKLYMSNVKGLLIFTFGAEHIWYGRNSISKFLPFKVNVADTAGAGDAFRAGVVYSLLNDFSDEELIMFSAAVSAAAVQSFPGVVKFKGLDEVKKILSENQITIQYNDNEL